MNDTKREELEKACKKKCHNVHARMVAVRMVRILNMSVEKTAAFRYGAPHCSTTGCAVTTKEALKAPDLPRCRRPRRIPRSVMDDIIANVAGCRITHHNCAIYFMPQNRSACRMTGDPNRWRAAAGTMQDGLSDTAEPKNATQPGQTCVGLHHSATCRAGAMPAVSSTSIMQTADILVQTLRFSYLYAFSSSS